MSVTENKTNKPILFVTTSNSIKGKTGIPTGFWLAELTHPYHVLKKAGFSIELASIKGGRPPIDGFDLSDSVNAELWADESFQVALAQTLCIDDVNPLRYSAIFFAGGHGTMWDFADNMSVQRVARDIYEAGGIVSAVCHGPAALVNIKLSNGSYLIDKKRVAAFTNQEEEEMQSTQIMPFLLETALVNHGAVHQPAANWAVNVVVDNRLITGQNPASAAKVGEEVAKLLLG